MSSVYGNILLAILCTLDFVLLLILTTLCAKLYAMFATLIGQRRLELYGDDQTAPQQIFYWGPDTLKIVGHLAAAAFFLAATATVAAVISIALLHRLGVWR